MPFAGEAFEEFVAAYLRYVEHYLTRAHVECKIERKGTKQARWSDIDVVGIRGNEAIVVSCDEYCRKEKRKIMEELKRAEEYVREEYDVVKVDKAYAFCVAENPNKDREKIRSLKDEGIIILTFTGMVKEFWSYLREHVKYGKTAGKFTEPILWALREMDEIRSFFPPNEDPFSPPSVEDKSKPSKMRKIIIKWPPENEK
jgi:hypothetical protein